MRFSDTGRIRRALAQPRTIQILAGIYFLAIAYFGLKYHLVGDGGSESDFYEAYAPQASAFLSGHIVIDAYRGPLYPMVLAVFSVPLRIFGWGLFEAGIILSALSAGTVLVLLHKVLTALFRPMTASAIVLFVAINPVFLRFAYTTGNDMVFMVIAMGQ